MRISIWFTKEPIWLVIIMPCHAKLRFHLIFEVRTIKFKLWQWLWGLSAYINMVMRIWMTEEDIMASIKWSNDGLIETLKTGFVVCWGTKNRLKPVSTLELVLCFIQREACKKLIFLKSWIVKWALVWSEKLPKFEFGWNRDLIVFSNSGLV